MRNITLFAEDTHCARVETRVCFIDGSIVNYSPVIVFTRLLTVKPFQFLAVEGAEMALLYRGIIPLRVCASVYATTS